ncbi:MAG: replicative DNA helicase [Flavobacteriaceae bacterium]|jgi:replicative DNA helicase|tara:strand:+ start:4534 stop:6018 length:1485 start_codon:yes stop_codon:yes gene_type:complete
MEEPNPLKIFENDPSSVININDGKLPPQAIDLEEAVIGAMLIDEKGVDEVIEILIPEVFYKKSHQLIFESIERLFRNSEPIDLLTVSADLKKNKTLKNIGGEYYLIELSQKVSSSAHIEFHARIIQQKFIQRKLIKISNEVIQKAYNESTDVIDLLDEAESKLYEITQGHLKKSSVSAEDLVREAKRKIEEIAKQEGLSGVSSGFDKLDKLTSGWQPSDLIIVASRPGMGKTALALSMARNMAITHKVPVAFFSLEMSSIQLITRLISAETGLKSDLLRTGKLAEHEWQQLNNQISGLESAPLFIDDTPSLTIFELRAKARRLVSSNDIKVIIIDYLQLMNLGSSTKTGNREQEISIISRNLKALAKELNIPVIALSQLSRAVETRSGSKRPILSDLRESGAIEQDADIVSFIYRPEYYGMENWDDDMQTPSQGQAEFIVAKHRNGALGKIRLKFSAELGKFEDIDSYDSPFEFQSKLNKSDQEKLDDKDDMPF